jgi:hypothetical protein
MNALASAAATAAGKELFKKVVVDLYDYCRNEMKIKLDQWTTESKLNSLFRRISTVKRVKTIWQVDKAVDLMTFYCDSHILIENKRKTITKISDFGETDNILIRGIAGQGKSILLRYLCANELCRGEYVPLFVELRRISSESSLLDRIIQAFRALQLQVDEKLFEALASSGKVLLLLDAFDEVPDQLKSQVLTQIEDLSAAHDRLRIVVTSRPYQDIQFSNHFAVVDLDNLRGSEYKQVIRKLASRQSWAEGLVKHIEEKADHIKDLLCTPLMVTLLVLSYKSYQKLPSKLSDFYDDLFQTLLQRHDGTKPGFTRQRGCALDDSEYRQVFECLCILLKRQGEQSVRSKVIYDLTKKSLEQTGHREKPAAFVDDIIKITCLIIRDGEEHRFIHRTVQEYYAASYVQKRPDSWASKFYHRILDAGTARLWRQELEFLAEIDEYRHNRYYALPSILRFLDITEEDLDREAKPLSRDYLLTALDNAAVYLEALTPKKLEARSPFLSLSWGKGPRSDAEDSFLANVTKYAARLIRELAFEKLTEDEIAELSETTTLRLPTRGKQYLGKEVVRMSVGKVLRKGLIPEVFELAERQYIELFEKAKELRNVIRKEESPIFLDGLI